MAGRLSRRHPAAIEAPEVVERSEKGDGIDDLPVDDLDVNFEAEVSKLRGRWELASVLNFLNVFESLFGKSTKISAEEIEVGLIKPDSALAELHILLLKGIPPVSKVLNGSDAWITVLCKKLAIWWPWVAEGEIPIKAAKGEEISNYKKLDPTSRLLILKALCEIRVAQDDAGSYISGCLKDGAQMSCFRKDRFGGDGNGTSYWYDGNPFLGFRLYKEVIKCESKLKGKSKATLALPMFSSQWETMATNLEEFHKVQDNLSCSKVISEVAVGKTIESDAIPVLEKLQKKKERSLKRRQRQEMQLNGFKNSCIGITRTCRIRTRVNYTFEDYDRAINDAIRLSKNGKNAEEQEQEQGMRRKSGRRDGTSTSENRETIVKSDSDDDSGKSNGHNDSDAVNDTLSDHNVDDTNNEDCDDDYDCNENENNDNSDSDDFDEQGTNEMTHSEKQIPGNYESSNHLEGENRKLGAKNRLRQRPILNSALDSVAVSDDKEDENEN